MAFEWRWWRRWGWGWWSSVKKPLVVLFDSKYSIVWVNVLRTFDRDYVFLCFNNSFLFFKKNKKNNEKPNWCCLPTVNSSSSSNSMFLTTGDDDLCMLIKQTLFSSITRKSFYCYYVWKKTYIKKLFTCTKTHCKSQHNLTNSAITLTQISTHLT
jgi:hypothetical protein